MLTFMDADISLRGRITLRGTKMGWDCVYISH